MGAYYRAVLSKFLLDDPSYVLGSLTEAVQHNELQRRQIKAWQREITLFRLTGEALIQQHPEAANWSLLLEYPIPRRQKRIDAVLLAADVIFCLEFKTEDKAHSLQAKQQAEEYALDLRDFHEESKDRRIVPIAIAPKAPSFENSGVDNSDAVCSVMLANSNDLADVLIKTFRLFHVTDDKPIEGKKWDQSAYRPVPTIIEAAEVLFAGHNVRDITHSHAGAINLTITSDRLVEIIQHAQRDSQKVICFVTGVPGAGKTLAGLNVVHNPALRGNGRPAGVFLSGNGPLVKIVSAAIARDFNKRKKVKGGERTASTLIQNVHVFVREGLDKPEPPFNRIVVFDEAQRAWDAEQNRKKNGQDMSEPEIMLSIMDRHQGWAVLIALVGGGQEINTGEAGLAEWGKTLKEKFPKWRVFVSPKALEEDASLAGHRLFIDNDCGSLKIDTEPALHLEVNLRSYRARKLAEWVDAVLNNEQLKAAKIFPELSDFPVALTRSLPTARKWLRKRTRGHRRCGLVASSGAIRLRADGIELSSGFRQGNRDMYVNWFLNLPPDIRSSNQLEVAASEFECQGLELDWAGVCWGGDFAFDSALEKWSYQHYAGSDWGNLNKEIDRQYLLNTYRVLLTRARKGLIIWVPEGDASDRTRLPESFNSTAEYLLRCGLQQIWINLATLGRN